MTARRTGVRLHHFTHRQMVHAGRAGALAIALGIGYGVAAAAPTAWADATDNTTATGAGARSAHGGPARPDKPNGQLQTLFSFKLSGLTTPAGAPWATVRV